MSRVRLLIFLGFFSTFQIPWSASGQSSESIRLSNPLDISLFASDKPGEFDVTTKLIYSKSWQPPLSAEVSIRISLETAGDSKVISSDGKPGEKQTVPIPSEGDALLLIRALASGNVIGQRTIVFNNGAPINHKPAMSPAKTITIAPIADFSHCPNVTSDITYVQSRVTANLVQNYHVTVLNRSDSLSKERQISEMSSLEKTFVDITGGLLAADVAFTGYYKIARKTPGSTSQVDLGCVLHYSDLNDTAGEQFQTIEFLQNEANPFEDNVTKEIVKALRLNPRRHDDLPKDNSLMDETWAVLPVTRLESDSKMNEPADESLALEIELALQQSGRVKRIVDRSSLNKVIEELKISSFDIAAGGVAGDIARIVGADKIISGVVGKHFENKTKLRMDLFLIDSRTATVLAAASATMDNHNIPDVAQKLLLELISKKIVVPETRTVAPETLDREAMLYHEILTGLPKSTINARNITTLALTFAESIYMIQRNDDFKVYRLAQFLLFQILLNQRMEVEQKIPISDFIYRILANIKHSDDTLNPRVSMARALAENPNRLNEALNIALEQVALPENQRMAYTNFTIGKCYFEMGDLQNAKVYAERSNLDSGLSLLKNIYRKLDDRSNDSKELECLQKIEAFKYSMGFDCYRQVQLTREVEGAAAAIELFNRLSSWARVRPEILTEVLKANVELGRLKEAAVIVYGLSDDLSWHRSNLDDNDLKNRLKEEVRKLREQLDDHVALWEPLNAFYDIPDRYKVYLRPVGNPDIAMLNNAVPLIEDFLGCRVEVLPCVPIPMDPHCYKKGRAQHHAHAVQYRLKSAVHYPKDALIGVEITDKDIYSHKLRYVYGSPYYGSKLISYHHWYSQSHAVMTDMLAKTVCSSIQESRHLRCYQPLCIFSSDGTAYGPKYQKFLACTNCSDKLKNVSADRIAGDFRSNYGRVPRMQDGDRREWQDEYNRVVKRVLAEAEESARGAAGKAVEHLPALLIEGTPSPGLSYKYFEFEKGECETASGLSGLEPKETGVTDSFDLSKAQRKEYYGLVFEGLVKIAHDGVYQFYLTSDDGSRLWIDGVELIDNDKMQAPFTKSAEVALKAGYHRIKLSYIQGMGGAYLTLLYRGPETLGQQITPDVLFKGN